MDSYDALLRSKDMTIQNLEAKIEKLKDLDLGTTTQTYKINENGLVVLK